MGNKVGIIIDRIRTNRARKHVYYFCRSITNGKRIKKQAKAKIDEANIPGMTKAKREEMAEDILRTYRKHGFRPGEYLGFHFYDKTEEERKNYIADWERIWYTDRFNDPSNAKKFDNKWVSYQTFKPYYKREVFYGSSEKDKKGFLDFASRHQDFVVKPVNGTYGRDVQVFKGGEVPDFAQLLKDYPVGFVAEEYVVQHPSIAEYHPTSVNTLRIITIRFDDETLVVHPRIKIGRHGSVIDNISAGGIFGIIDPETGRMIYAGDYSGASYQIHPDSGAKLVDSYIPRWDECLAFAKEIASIVPDTRYVGWDLSLTEKGWVIIEGNRRAQFGWQYSYEGGARQEIEGYLARLKKK